MMSAFQCPYLFTIEPQPNNSWRIFTKKLPKLFLTWHSSISMSIISRPKISSHQSHHHNSHSHQIFIALNSASILTTTSFLFFCTKQNDKIATHTIAKQPIFLIDLFFCCQYSTPGKWVILLFPSTS